MKLIKKKRSLFSTIIIMAFSVCIGAALAWFVINLIFNPSIFALPFFIIGLVIVVIAAIAAGLSKKDIIYFRNHRLP